MKKMIAQGEHCVEVTLRGLRVLRSLTAALGVGREGGAGQRGREGSAHHVSLLPDDLVRDQAAKRVALFRRPSRNRRRALRHSSAPCTLHRRDGRIVLQQATTEAEVVIGQAPRLPGIVAALAGGRPRALLRRRCWLQCFATDPDFSLLRLILLTHRL
jgi:hypothetical protein